MKQNSKKYAITGGIGSGKSTVCNIIKQLGYRVVSCDEVYKRLLYEDSFVKMLSNEFGDVLDCNGRIDKSKLSAIVFENREKLKRLNKITHPIIMQRALKEMEGLELSFCEVPLLFEGGFQQLFDGVIVVLRDLAQRVESVCKRDNLTANEVKNRINSQFNYDIDNFEKYYVIHNNGNLQELYDDTAKMIKNIV